MNFGSFLSFSRFSEWHLPSMRYQSDNKRDERIDFLRGIAISMMVITHIEIISFFNVLTWERFGFITGAEAFVILSGFVLGFLNRTRVQNKYLLTVSYSIYQRAAVIYFTNICIILIIVLLNQMPFINMHELTSFTDRMANISYPTYPWFRQNTESWFNLVLGLKIGPHQTQILGLYVMLLFVTPLIIALLRSGMTYILCLCSLALYIIFQLTNVRITPAQFSAAFPILAWQFIFVMGFVCGWYKDEIFSWANRTAMGLVTKYLLVIVALFFLFVAQNHANAYLPRHLYLDFIPSRYLDVIYNNYASKNELGPLRVLNDVSLIATGYLFLSFFWTPFKKCLGWFFICLGQNSLYCFIIHVFIVLLVAQLVRFDFHSYHWLFNTLIHLLALVLLWLCAKFQLGRKFIPN